VLAGGGPADVIDLTLALAREMLDLAGLDADPQQAIASGRAMDVWRRMVTAQGGDPDAPLPKARHARTITAETSGYLTHLDALGVGIAAWRLGAGRARKEDSVSPGAGILLHAKPGDMVTQGQKILTMFTDDDSRFGFADDALTGAFTIGSTPDVHQLPLILERIDA
jgi:thymidine phosphorylase